MKRHDERPSKLYVAILVGVAAIFAASPLLAAPAGASQSKSVATRLLGKPVEQMREHFDPVRNRPSPQADLAKTFAERDYYQGSAVASLSDEDQTSMFFDMRHDIDQVTETWHGSAGVQIVW